MRAAAPWPPPRAGMIAASLAVAWACSGCTPPAHAANWEHLRVGMSRDEVSSLLGTPSSRVVLRSPAGPADPAATGAPAGERWQYGDSLSSLATGALFPDQADERTWSVFFSSDGTLTGFRPPAWEAAARSAEPRPGTVPGP